MWWINTIPTSSYTDGTVQQPFTGSGTGTGIKADAMQRVIADFYNRTLERRGKVDTFSIVKFRKKTNGTVNTEEFGIPARSNRPAVDRRNAGGRLVLRARLHLRFGHDDPLHHRSRRSRRQRGHLHFAVAGRFAG
jgi:hypothetical protein